MTTTSSASRLSSQEQAQLIYRILSDVYDKSPWTLEQVVADLALDTTEYFYVYNQEEVVGFLALQNLVGEIEVTNIAVLKAYQMFVDNLKKSATTRACIFASFFENCRLVKFILFLKGLR